MEEIKKYFSGLNSRQIAQYEALGAVYKDWNSKINVISRKDMDNFYHSHVLHSLSIAKFINFKEGTNVLDAGTGGGFPGLPLSIMFPSVNFILVDSIAKKLKVIDSVCDELEINNIRTVHSRIEDLDVNCDFVVSRAVSRLDTMWNWASKAIDENHKNIIKNGLIYLKGGDITDEVPNNTFIQKIDVNELFKDTVFNEKAIVYITKKQG